MDEDINKAIILAAGMGVRLKPLTNDLPKCLLKVDSKIILEHQIENLKKCGVNQITIVVGYKAQMIKDFCNGHHWQINFVENKDYVISDNFFSFWLSKEYFTGGFVCLNSDVLFDINILKKLMGCNEDITIVVEQKSHYNQEDMKVIIDDKKIIEIGRIIELNKVDGEFIGMTKISDKGALNLLHYFDGISADEIKNMCFGEGIQKLIEKGYNIHAFIVNKEPCIEVDFLEDLEEASKHKW